VPAEADLVQSAASGATAQLGYSLDSGDRMIEKVVVLRHTKPITRLLQAYKNQTTEM